MKTKFMMALAMGLMLFGAMQSVARDFPQKEVMEKVQAIQAHLSQKNPEAKMLHFDSPPLSMPMRQQADPQTDEELVTITCKMVWNEEEMPGLRPKHTMIQSTDLEYYASTPYIGDPEIFLYAPKGKECYVYGVFQDFYGFIVIVKSIFANENEEVIINAADADQEINFKPIMPNGEPLSVDVIDYDEEYNEIVVEPGTVHLAFYQLLIFSDNMPSLGYLSGNYLRFPTANGDIFDDMDYISIKTNNNDRVHLYNRH